MPFFVHSFLSCAKDYGLTRIASLGVVSATPIPKKPIQLRAYLESWIGAEYYLRFRLPAAGLWWVSLRSLLMQSLFPADWRR